MLNDIRTKREGWQKTVEKLNAWAESNEIEDPLYICARRADADFINKKFYRENKNEEFVFKGKKTGNFRVSDLLVPEEVKLKKGLKIIMCANDREAGYLNGETGYVEHVSKDEIWVMLEGKSSPLRVQPYEWESYRYTHLMGSIAKEPVGKFKQYPIKQANAITAHKSQSTTLDKACVHLGSGAFAAGMTYVALSRVRSLRNMTLWRPIEEDDIIVSKAVSEWYNSID